MAHHQQVKQYLAYWFQLGKQAINSRSSTQLCPEPVIHGDRYSQSFEASWQTIQANPGHWHLEGTTQTIAELLSPKWELSTCSRCSMPVPMPDLGMPAENCPCSDLPTWPNLDLPQPRLPVDSQGKLGRIYTRITGQEAD